MGKQLKKIVNNVLTVCVHCPDVTECKKLVGWGCTKVGGNIKPEFKEES